MAKRAKRKKHPKRRYEVGVQVGPEEAKELLAEMDPDNRGVRWTHVQRIAEKMKAGLWKPNAEVIKVDWDGVVVDGQHRLLAIVRSGVTVEVDICYGVEPDAVYTMDEGRNRHLRDKISREFPDLKRKKIYREVAMIYTKVADYDLTSEDGYQAWGRRNRTSWNYPEVFRWVRRHKSALDFIIGECKREGGREFMRPLSIMGALYFICHRADPDEAFAFFTMMIDGMGYPRGKEEPAYWCRREIERLHAARQKGSDPARWPYMTAVCAAFNAHLRGETITSTRELRVTAGEPFEKIQEPSPKRRKKRA